MYNTYGHAGTCTQAAERSSASKSVMQAIEQDPGMVSFVTVGMRLMKEYTVKLAWRNSCLVSILVSKDLFWPR